jgi:hypothetical protein
MRCLGIDVHGFLRKARVKARMMEKEEEKWKWEDSA